MKHKNNKQFSLWCSICGLKFWVSPCRKNIAKYCSKRCRQTGQIGKKWSKVDRNRTCLVCNKTFQADYSNLKNGYAKYCSSACYGKSLENKLGKLSHHWKGGITPLDKKERVRFRDTIQKLIFERDNYTCQICGIKNGNGKTVCLQVDHIQPWAKYIELRFDVNNCRTLCQKCHYKVTYRKDMSNEIKTWGHNFKCLTRKETCQFT